METTTQNGMSSGNGGAQPMSGDKDPREKLMTEMKTVIGNAESWLKNSATRTGEEMGAAKEKFDETLQTAKSDLMQLEASMLAKTKLAARATDVYVKDNPWKSVGLGGALGIIFGLLVSRK